MEILGLPDSDAEMSSKSAGRNVRVDCKILRIYYKFSMFSVFSRWI